MAEETTRDEIFNGHRITTSSHDAVSDRVVVFCHGFKGVKTGPSRLFVKAARMLAEHEISSLRFDQYGSGDSDGEFIDSSFLDWIATTEAIVDHYLAAGHRVALFGQSMGGATAIAVAAENPKIEGVVGWCAGASLGAPNGSPDDIEEEGGQLLRASYWHEAHDARVAERLRM
jgi:pimeloyl-ACP methyl ester carboxylesterase